MKRKLFLLLTLLVSLWGVAQTGLQGVVIDSKDGQPVVGATVILDNQGLSAVTGINGDFLITGAQPGADRLLVLSYGFNDWSQDVTIIDNVIEDVGTIRLGNPSSGVIEGLKENVQEIKLTEQELEDEEGNTQAVGTLSGANDNPFYQAASFGFSIMRFRIRGYNSEYTQNYINGVYFNDAARGRFNYSMIGGMNQAFRNKNIGMGLESKSFGFGDVGGVNNINTFAKDYAPGFRGSVAFTNGNYKWRGMVTYASGLNDKGWALTLSGVVRWANEGIIPGSFYNSAGLFVSVQKILNQQHSFSLVAFAAPTKRASNSATFEEAYQLTGTNLYNSNWGWQEGEKRNARVVESLDPTVIFNWVWTPDQSTSLNTGLAFHKSYYSSSALNWYNARDPRPDYYRYLPSYYQDDPVTAQLYTDLWENDDNFRQLNWSDLYNTNYMNNFMWDQTGEERGSTYIIEKRHSNQANWQLNSNLNKRLTDVLTLQGGVGAGYTRSSYYKTMKDLLGGRFWLDVDQFAERDFPSDQQTPQNNLEDPNRKIYKGDRFGYDYDINQFNANLWAQNMIILPKWEFNYGVNVSYTTYQRDGHMRNGRAPENSYGKGESHSFANYGVKAGAKYKLDGRNNFFVHAFHGTRAPLSYNAYVSPRIKDDVITNLKSEKLYAVDAGYEWNYRRFKGVISGFYTEMHDGTERTSFYDDLNGTFMNYALTGVKKVFKGVEVGLSYKLTSAVTISAAANIADYRYKNRPLGTRSYENGSQPDVTQPVYLKNFYVGGTPQEAYQLGLNYAAPHSWFFEVNGAWMNRAYVDLSPIRHETMGNLWTTVTSEQELVEKMKDIATQEKLREALVINMSIGKFIRLQHGASLNLNLNINNLLNNTHIQTGGYQQGRFDYKNFTSEKFPNKYYYAQGIKIFLNVGVRF